MIPLAENFCSVEAFDKTVTKKLSPYFDLDFVRKDTAEYNLWLNNLCQLASQNLGLAHCVLHNQTARNALQTAGISSSYADTIGAFHLNKNNMIDGNKKVFNLDTMRLNGSRLSGTAFWNSQLHVADYIVLRVLDQDNNKRWVYLELKNIQHQISYNNFDLAGMQIAQASNFTIDADIPSESILDFSRPISDFHPVTNLHKYGTIANHTGICQALLKRIVKICLSNNYNLQFELSKLVNQVDVLTILWEMNLPSVHQPFSKKFWYVFDAQYTFSKKTLTDLIAFCTPIYNSSDYNTQSESYKTFKDAMIYSTHVQNLYRSLNFQFANYKNNIDSE